MVVKKYVERYSPSKTAARDLEERLQTQQGRNFNNYSYNLLEQKLNKIGGQSQRQTDLE